jgi:hypothetical protein
MLTKFCTERGELGLPLECFCRVFRGKTEASDQEVIPLQCKKE